MKKVNIPFWQKQPIQEDERSHFLQCGIGKGMATMLYKKFALKLKLNNLYENESIFVTTNKK
ncbi:hypothetical protein B0I26_10818 [Anoxybacillus vitaminiphilus]|uniref:Uncharacterized protein n=1 Tax=Paranoxybacillus vitaminiphilus TaxID=581036 RepID=A0A327YCX7_9BACL|nr:hypothetical protein B0I26_10818 [Anoxybacillus vitaminiphilus]